MSDSRDRGKDRKEVYDLKKKKGHQKFSALKWKLFP